MDYIKDLHELCDTLNEAIRDANEKIRNGGGKLSVSDADYVDRLTHALKSVKAVIAMDDGYSGRYPRKMMRYSRDEHPMIRELRELMQEAPDDRTRQEFQRFISKIETM